MELKENGFYIIKDSFFTKYKDSFLLDSKTTNRPHFFLIKDRIVKDVYWAIPMSRQLDKALKKIREDYDNKEEKCPYYVINKNSQNPVFSIGNSFPILKKYVEREFERSNRHLILKDSKILKKVESKFDNYLKFINRYSNRTPILSIFDDLIKELELDKYNEIINKQNEALNLNKEIDDLKTKNNELESLINKFETLYKAYNQTKIEIERIKEESSIKLLVLSKINLLKKELKNIINESEALEKSSGMSILKAKNILALNNINISTLSNQKHKKLEEKSYLEKEYSFLKNILNNQNNSNTNDTKIENVQKNTLN